MTDTTPHYCAGCGAYGCVEDWKRRAEPPAGALLVVEQWRACARDDGDMYADSSEWQIRREDAENTLSGLRDSEPAYDEFWIEVRWCSEPVRVVE